MDTNESVYSESEGNSEPAAAAAGANERKHSAISARTHMQVIERHAREFLEDMNAEAIVTDLEGPSLIPPDVQRCISQPKSKKNANNHLLRFLKEDADTEQVLEILKIAAKARCYGRMNHFADILLKEIQQDRPAAKRKGSLDTPAPPSHHHHGILHTQTAGLIDSVVDIINAKKPPLDAIKCLYFSFYSELLEILNTCCESIRQAAFKAVRMGQVSATEEEVKQANNLEALFTCLKIDEKWHDITFLGVAIRRLPPEKAKEKEAALMILNMYRSHLWDYTTATSIKEGKAMFLLHQPGMKETRTVMKITVRKNPEDYTCSDCLELWKRFLNEALEIPADHSQFIDAKQSNSTTLVFMVPRTAAMAAQDKLSRPAVIWVMKELGILRVHVAGVYQHEVLPTVPADSIRDGLKSGVDFIALTKNWSPLRCPSVEQTLQSMKTQLKPLALRRSLTASPDVSNEEWAQESLLPEEPALVDKEESEDIKLGMPVQETGSASHSELGMPVQESGSPSHSKLVAGHNTKQLSPTQRFPKAGPLDRAFKVVPLIGLSPTSPPKADPVGRVSKSDGVLSLGGVYKSDGVLSHGRVSKSPRPMAHPCSANADSPVGVWSFKSDGVLSHGRVSKWPHPMARSCSANVDSPVGVRSFMSSSEESVA